VEGSTKVAEDSITLAVEVVSIKAEVVAEVAVMQAEATMVDQEPGSCPGCFDQCPLKINKHGLNFVLSREEVQVILWQVEGRT